jgi:hypothetical protein
MQLTNAEARATGWCLLKHADASHTLSAGKERTAVIGATSGRSVMVEKRIISYSSAV